MSKNVSEVLNASLARIRDMADANIAQRAYEANLAVINITKTMAQRAVEIGK